VFIKSLLGFGEGSGESARHPQGSTQRPPLGAVFSRAGSPTRVQTQTGEYYLRVLSGVGQEVFDAGGYEFGAVDDHEVSGAGDEGELGVPDETG
jgi:hypothetical protein